MKLKGKFFNFILSMLISSSISWILYLLLSSLIVGINEQVYSFIIFDIILLFTIYKLLNNNVDKINKIYVYIAYLIIEVEIWTGKNISNLLVQHRLSKINNVRDPKGLFNSRLLFLGCQLCWLLMIPSISLMIWNNGMLDKTFINILWLVCAISFILLIIIPVITMMFYTKFSIQNYSHKERLMLLFLLFVVILSLIALFVFKVDYRILFLILMAFVVIAFIIYGFYSIIRKFLK